LSQSLHFYKSLKSNQIIKLRLRFILDSERTVECIDFTMIFFFCLSPPFGVVKMFQSSTMMVVSVRKSDIFIIWYFGITDKVFICLNKNNL